MNGDNERSVGNRWGLYRVRHVDGLAGGVAECILNMGVLTFAWIQNGAVVKK